MAEPIRILTTRPLDDDSMALLHEKGLHVDVVSLIDTTPVEDIATTRLIQECIREKAVAIFTSMNAVQSVADRMFWDLPHWDIYTLGSATRERVVRYFGESSIAGTGHDAASLADRIIADAPEPDLIFFCGDIRRDELPERIRAAGLNLREVTVYHTRETPRRIDGTYDAILFFSPSAVRSFFVANTATGGMVMFAIGATTAAEIRKACGNDIVISDAPGKGDMAATVVAHFAREQG
jgi:uroporphyrinogen-III synthase